MEHNLGVLAAQFLGIFHGTLCHVAQQRSVSIVTCTLRHLQDDGALQVARCLDDSLELLHVVEVECGDGISTVDGTCEHFLGVHEAE